MRRSVWAMAVLLGAVGLGCDDKSDVPPEVLSAQPAPTTKQGPTTRELLDAPRKSFKLGSFPLTLQVPENWNLHSMGNGEVITVGGPATSGDIDIQLVQQGETVNANGPESALAAAKKEMADKPHEINRAEIRPLGPGKVLEVRMISNAYVNGQLPPEVWGDAELPDSPSAVPGAPKRVTRAILNPHMVKWTFTVYLPAGEKKYSVRSLSFMGLGLREYQRDKEFLEGMMKTLKYEE